ncbi:hypothetical protein OHD62_19275 [Mesorhizobium sp. YC-39]|uniref:DUF6894 family protein n=1 Tax=unclassified Mesorhizobium TaxID=325217 RepID=UPI0021E8CACB|nr:MULTISPECIES: hypothetical protein [unclassified Mesorhizobium]MCV3209986.1 hypothetical protein [Mesorhizobium sp. YC-2]MCV3230516.1 hypothetical protein [Mesorhizobium sp. YC-39]
MARFYFDVQRDEIDEPDLVGTELLARTLVPDLALELALEIAREALPRMMKIIISVRDGEPAPVFQATLLLDGKWHR